MKFRILQFGLVLCLFTSVAFAQSPPASADEVTTHVLNMPVYAVNPTPIPGANLTLSGNPGPVAYYYWAVANYQVGSVVSPLGFVQNAPNVLSGSNFIKITPYSYPPSVATVDFLRTTTFVSPTGACNCAVATGVTSGSVNDQSNSLSSYTVPNFNPNQYTVTLTNEVVANNSTHLIYRQNGAFVTDLAASGSGGTITAVNPGPGLAGGGGSGSVTLSLITCPTGQTPISNGSGYACGTAGGSSITAVNTASGSGLSGGGSSGALSLTLLTTCSTSQVLAWDGSAWACASPGVGTITGVNTNTGSGLTGGGLSGTLTLGLLTSCSVNQVLEWSGSAWACASLSGSLPSGTVGQTLAFNSGATIVSTSSFIDNTQSGGTGVGIAGPATVTNASFQFFGTAIPAAALSCGSNAVGFGAGTDGLLYGCNSGGTYLLGSALWSGLQNPTTDLSLLVGTHKTTWTIADFVASPSTGVFSTTDTASSTTDLSVNWLFNTGASSRHTPLMVQIQGINQLQVCWQPGPQGETVIGSALTCPNISTTPFSKFVVQSLTNGHTVERLYKASTGDTGMMLEMNNATAPGTGWKFFQACASATAGDSTCTSGTVEAQLLGNGTLTVQNLTIAALTSGPTCLQQTGGVVSSSGSPCGSGSATTIQTNGTNNTTQSPLNFITSSTNLVGLILTPINPAAGNERMEITGLTNTTGGGTGLSAPAAHSLLVAEGASVMTLITSPVVNGFYACGFNVTASAVVDPGCTLQGIAVNAQSGNYSMLYSDRLAYLKESGTTTSTLTLCQITGNCAANYAFVTQNLNSSTETLQANAADKIDGGATGGTQTILSKWAAWVYSDSSSAPGNWSTIITPTFAAFGTTCITALQWSTSTGIGCPTQPNLAIAALPTATRAGDVLYWDGSIWNHLAGNNSGTNCFQENGSGVPSFGACSGGGSTTVANGTAALGTSAIGSGACATVVTSTATGVATTDNVMADFNADPTSTTGYSASANGMLTIIKYPTTNNVNFKVCNNTAASVTPGAVTLNWRVVR